MLRRYAYGSRERNGFEDRVKVILKELWAARSLCDATYNHWLGSVEVSESLKALSRKRLRSARQGLSSKDLDQQWYALRKEVQGTINQKALWAALNQALSPLWWQWRNIIFREMRQRLRLPIYNLSPVSVRMAPQNESDGSIIYLFARPVSVSQLMAGKTPVSLVIDGKSARLTMPVARQDKRYETCSWDFTFHRELPDDAKVHEIAVSGTMKSGQWRLSVSFLLELPDTEKVPVDRVAAYYTTSKHYICGHENLVTRAGDIVCAGCKQAYDRDENAALWLRGTDDGIGIDVGWRMTRQGLRVATAAIDEAHFESLHLSPAWILQWDFVEDLDAALNESAIAVSPSLASRRIPWMDLERDSSPAAQAWQEKTQKKRFERRSKRLRLERWRLHLYRDFARRIAAIDRPIRLEKLNLKNMMRADSRQGPAQKQQQQMAAVSELQRVIEEACGVK